MSDSNPIEAEARAAAVPADERTLPIDQPVSMADQYRASGLKDSGDRTEIHGGAVRDRAPGKGRYDLISPVFLKDLAVLLENGAEKYAVRNWERGYTLALCQDSAMRHLVSLLAGEDDEDHAIAVAWNMMAYVAIRDKIKKGLLPESLAHGSVPMHFTNPVTGQPDAV